MDKPQNARNKKMRSSPEARKLIAVYLKKYGTERAAARALNIPQAQLSGMKHGRLRDTPGMVVQLKRRKRKSQRAFYSIDAEPTLIDDCATLRAALRALEQSAAMIKVILQQCDARR